MIRRAAILALLLVVPLADAQPALPQVTGVAAVARNHEVTLIWDALDDPAVVGYVVNVYLDGILLVSRNTTTPRHVVSPLTNQVSYAFTVAARNGAGDVGPASAPVAATPTNDRDLLYLAAGLIVTWLTIFGYAAVLARREAQIDRKLDQLLAHRTREENP